MKKIKWGQIYVSSVDVLEDQSGNKLFIPIKVHPKNPYAVVIYDVQTAEELNCGSTWFDEHCSILETTE